jgi:kynurenine formamidase
VILYTGWQEKWGNAAAFFNEDATGMHFPGFSSTATQFLLRDRKIAGVGIDTHGADPGQDEEYATNTQVLAQQGMVLENLTNLQELPATGTTLVIGMLRLAGGSGSPVSVLAFIP